MQRTGRRESCLGVGEAVRAVGGRTPRRPALKPPGLRWSQRQLEPSLRDARDRWGGNGHQYVDPAPYTPRSAASHQCWLCEFSSAGGGRKNGQRLLNALSDRWRTIASTERSVAYRRCCTKGKGRDRSWSASNLAGGAAARSGRRSHAHAPEPRPRIDPDRAGRAAGRPRPSRRPVAVPDGAPAGLESASRATSPAARRRRCSTGA